MYNRYIPQPDGSYRRNRIADPHHPSPPPPKMTQEPSCTPEPPPPVRPPQSPPRYRKPYPKSADSSVSGFLRKLLPKDFDTGDLIIVLLLLLMAGDCAEDQNTALLTLALYFFM